ncbi:fasciclin domain-containing protein [Saxibacter everestensis]|uniref:Fasciclin domain-containing protein n=1 Tax=Saxibacter everestensis TaxID=2909229 RepID=A0ABY8QPI7_9MICO|nr:fasciclin domain-containing protein [Brevibacteriaceae bacterium ZFBP1038]
MLRKNTKYSALLAVTGAAVLMLSACSGGGGSSSETSSAAPEAAPTTEAMAEGPVGPGCAAYAEANADGPGSVQGMSEAKVAEAAGANPLLKTLTQAVSGELNPDVNLVSTLDGGEFTVFAPVDDAFGKIDDKTIETLKTDADLLSKILTYHVIEGQIAPDAIVGTHKTVQGGEVEVSGSPEELMVNGESAVICGGVKTANATVYMIDTVLMPE